MSRISKEEKKIIDQIDTDLLFCNTDDLDLLLKSILTVFFDLTDTRIGSIQLYQQKRSFTKVHCQFPDKIRRFFKYDDGCFVYERAIMLDGPVIIEDFKSQSQIQGCPLLNVTAYMCVPLHSDKKIVGFVNLIKTKDVRFFYPSGDLLCHVTQAAGKALTQALLNSEIEERKTIENDMADAVSIQDQLLPINIPYAPHIEFGAVSIPSKDLSGDFYQFLELPGDRVGVVLADITGKGIQAGLFMAMVKSLVRLFLPEFDSPKDALKKVNDLLIKRRVINQYIPLFYAVVDPSLKTMTYCNAGMEPGLCFRQGVVSFLEVGGPPLGAFLDSEYLEDVLYFERGDAVIMITDGITDIRNENDVSFGIEKVVELIRKNMHFPIQDQLNHMMYVAKNFMEDRSQKDDVTLLGFKFDETVDNLFEIDPDVVERIFVESSLSEFSSVESLLRYMLSRYTCAESIKENYVDALHSIIQAIIQYSYFGVDTGSISIQFLGYSDKVELVIKECGQGLSEGELKRHLQKVYDFFDRIQFRISKIGSEIHVIKKILR